MTLVHGVNHLCLQLSRVVLVVLLGYLHDSQRVHHHKLAHTIDLQHSKLPPLCSCWLQRVSFPELLFRTCRQHSQPMRLHTRSICTQKLSTREVLNLHKKCCTLRASQDLGCDQHTASRPRHTRTIAPCSHDWMAHMSTRVGTRGAHTIILTSEKNNLQSNTENRTCKERYDFEYSCE